jgi:predicted RNA methylase
VDRGALDELWQALANVPRAHAASTRDARRAAGVVFTPEPLARFVARQTLAPLATRASSGAATITVLDPAAGDGRFLAAAAAVLGELGVDAARVRLVGIERDPEHAAAARARVPSARVIVGEALLGLGGDLTELGEVDAVIGNPPYVRSIRLRQSDPDLWSALRGRFVATSHGEWDLYAAFLERSLAWVRAGGRIGLVVPSRWLTARYAGGLRDALGGSMRAVVDFGAAQVFPDATTYASVVVMQRDAAGVVAVARRDAGAWAVGELDARALGAAPWVLAVGGAAAAFARLAGGRTLGDVARIAKGAGTNADPVFVLPDAVVDGELVRAGDVVVEAAATRPCLRGRDVVAWGALDLARPHPRCIVPYAGRALVGWAELSARWPRAAAYLAAHRRVLEAREDGRFAGDGFHAFGRPQNLELHLDPAAKVVVPDVAHAARAQLDTTGALVIDSAYAVRPTVTAGPWADAALLLALLSSPVVRRWLEVSGVPLRGGYVRMKTAFLAPLPLPSDGPDLAAAAAAARAGDRAAAESALARAFDLAV